MPSRILFDSKQRPKGLEFPSCQACQDSTRKAELVIAMLSRFYPNPATDQQRKEIKSIMRSAFHNNPGLINEMHMDQVKTLASMGANAFKLPSWAFINTGGPIARNAVNLFGQKLAIALHFETTGQIVPKGAGIFVQQYSNYDAVTDGLPKEMISILGEERTLQMGRSNVGAQFSYQSNKVVDGQMTGHMCYFRQSLALFLVVYPDLAEVPSEGLPHLMII